MAKLMSYFLIYFVASLIGDQSLAADANASGPIYDEDQVNAILKINTESIAKAMNDIKQSCPITSMIIMSDASNGAKIQPKSKYAFLAKT